MKRQSASMTLKSILPPRGGSVISIGLRTDLRTAAKLLSSHATGALAVLDDGGRLVGLLSERDIVRKMAHTGDNVLHLQVADVMIRDVPTCDVNDSIGNVVDCIRQGTFRNMVVLDEGRLADLVSADHVLQLHIIETLREHVGQLRSGN